VTAQTIGLSFHRRPTGRHTASPPSEWEVSLLWFPLSSGIPLLVSQ